MSSYINHIKGVARYYIKSKTIQRVHSPFLFDFCQEVLENNRHYYAFDDIEKQRKELIKSNISIKLTGYGTNSHSRNVSLKEIIQKSVSGKAKSKLLFHLCAWFKPQQVLELGTNIGISSAYMAKACLNSNLITIEGEPSLHKIANNIHRSLNLSNIENIQGDFETQLQKLLLSNPRFDMVYFDGHHDFEHTIKFYNVVKPFLSKNACLIFDDIHWSKDMEKAWSAIQSMSESKICIDLYQMGIVFNQKALPNKNIQLIPFKFKPWESGIFKS